jgi:hypothetical protein
MFPVLLPGDTVQFELWPQDVRIGDILVFFARGGVQVHRVIRMAHRSDAMYVTKGDNAAYFDDSVQGSGVLGKVVSLREGSGRIVDLRTQSPWRIYWTVQISELLADIRRLCHSAWVRMSRSLHIVLPAYPFYKVGEFLSVPARLVLCLLLPTPLRQRGIAHFAREFGQTLSFSSSLKKVYLTPRREGVAGSASGRDAR